MTSHFTGGGPQSSWDPPPHILELSGRPTDPPWISMDKANGHIVQSPWSYTGHGLFS